LLTTSNFSERVDLENEEEQRPVRSMLKYEYEDTHAETEESPYNWTWYVI